MFDIQRTFSRTELLIGKENIEKLRDKKVAIFGLGGVGSFVTEGIIRCGIKNLILVDNDEISPSNINRQLYALQSTIGKKKTDLAKERCLDINPLANIQTFNLFYLEETQNQIDLSNCDYIIDAIDTVSAKLLLIENAKKLNEIGEELSKEYNIPWLVSDFKKKNGYKRSIELSSEYDLYRQDYCGCVYSKQEREEKSKNSKKQ